MSQQPDYNNEKEDNQEVILLLPYLFGDKIQSAVLDVQVEESQKQDKTEFEKTTHYHR